MKHITIIKEGDPYNDAGFNKDMDVSELFDGSFRRIVEARLQNSAVLKKHKADVPITVFCVSGNGTFLAGPQLEDSQSLRVGTLITLEAGVEHEVVAEPALNLIVTKFKAN